MTRRSTFSELVWPDGDDGDLAINWAAENSSRILNWTWQGFENLVRKHVPKVDFSKPLEQLERDLVRHHFVEIQLIFAQETDGFASLPETGLDCSEKKIGFGRCNQILRWAIASESRNS